MGGRRSPSPVAYSVALAGMLLLLLLLTAYTIYFCVRRVLGQCAATAVVVSLVTGDRVTPIVCYRVVPHAQLRTSTRRSTDRLCLSRVYRYVIVTACVYLDCTTNI